MIRKISANLMITGDGKVLKNSIVTVDESGLILDITDTGGRLREAQNIEFYNGVLVPGFINAHCHLELSAHKSLIPKHTGLPDFIGQVGRQSPDAEQIQKAMKQADDEMRLNGIVAVGDISNGLKSVETKAQSRLHYHTFLEILNRIGETSQSVFDNVQELQSAFGKSNLSAVPVPHASYSVKPDLAKMIRAHNPDSVVISLHNQETESENLLYQTQTGAMMERLEAFGFDYSDFQFSGKSSLQSFLPFLNPKNNILLVHNTFTQVEDIDFAESYSSNIYWTFCPGANLYIENRLPNISKFFEKDVKICFGTDSYASNTQLSVFEELKIVKSNFPEIEFEKLIESACSTGAKALKIDHKYGSLEIGKTPGINLIEGFDFQTNRPRPESRIRVLV